MQVEQESNKSKAIAAGVVAAVLGLGVGFAVAWAVKGNQGTTTPVTTTATVPTTATKAADLRALLNGLEREHVNLAADATRAGFDGTTSFAPAAAQLDKNSHDIADAVGSVYGADAGKKFYDIWNSHIGFFVNYTVAAKKGDKAGMDKAVTDLGGYNDAISDFFSTANPNLPRDAVHELIANHIVLLKTAVDNYGAKDIAGSFAKEHEANVQIGQIADAISGAIVKQYPSKF